MQREAHERTHTTTTLENYNSDSNLAFIWDAGTAHMLCSLLF
jgi:hypothetical protein